MNVLVISPDYASHYGPLAVLARAARDAGHRVTVATGAALRARVEADRFEWRRQRLGAGSNVGVVERDPAIDRFLGATHRGPIATLSLQARDRAEDLLWEPVRVAREIADLCDDVQPDEIVVDHVSFGSTLALYATGRPFVSVVPGHPTQLPVGDERYGVPPRWPDALRPEATEITELERLVDRVTGRFTETWNAALAEIAPWRPSVDDAFRVHGHRVLYNSVGDLHDPSRGAELPPEHRFVGPLVREESLPGSLTSWSDRADGRPRVYVALGTFLSHRSDVLARLAAALRMIGARAAIATGPTPPDALGPVPPDWLVAPSLPQVALLPHADLAIHHGGNNSVQESLAAGVRQLVLPFSTDQFANAADLERTGLGSVAAPNTVSTTALAVLVARALAQPPTGATPRCDAATLVAAVTDGVASLTTG